jgi:hypothetical protein
LLLSFAASAVSAQDSKTQATSRSRTEDVPTQEPQPTPPPYEMNRQDEDWSMMRDPARRSDWSDKLKYIPLGEREGWYASVGGEARPYYERYRNEEWGSTPQDLSGYWLQRFLLHGDFHFGKRVRFFGQLQSGIEAGKRGGPAPPDEDKLDVLQAFVDVAWNSNPERSLTLRAGRQELDYGSGRLISIRDGTNVRQTFDGAKLMLRAGNWNVDGFVVKPVENDAGFFDDAPISSETLWGVYAVRPLPHQIPIGKLDLYYLGFARRSAHFDQGTARETRHTLGTRLSGATGGSDYDAEFIRQFGSFGNGDLSAWAAGVEYGYTLRRMPLSPRPGFKANVTSGDGDPNDSDLGTFHPLFPKGAYFGQLASIGPLNHRDLHPTLDLTFPRGVSLTADWVFYWRQSLRDGVYSVPGDLLRTGQLSAARFIGHQPDFEVRWHADRHATFILNYGRFFVGRFLRETPPAENTTFVAAWITYQF